MTFVITGPIRNYLSAVFPFSLTTFEAYQLTHWYMQIPMRRKRLAYVSMGLPGESSQHFDIRICVFQSVLTSTSSIIWLQSNNILLIEETVNIISEMTLKWWLRFHGNSSPLNVKFGYLAVFIQNVKTLCSERIFNSR